LRPGATYNLQKLAAYLTAHPGRTIAIEGYRIRQAEPQFEQRLSEQRVGRQAAHVNMGIDSRRTIVRGYGADYPVASNATPAGRQMNRRVEIVVSDRAGLWCRAVKRGEQRASMIAMRAALITQAVDGAVRGPLVPVRGPADDHQA
jgi:hypothetical protein